jgi:hypothetical protein
MVHEKAREIFGKKTEEYAPLLEELEKEAVRAGVDVGDMYSGLESVKDLIKGKEDLKMIVELGKEAVKGWS